MGIDLEIGGIKYVVARIALQIIVPYADFEKVVVCLTINVIVARTARADRFRPRSSAQKKRPPYGGLFARDFNHRAGDLGHPATAAQEKTSKSKHTKRSRLRSGQIHTNVVRACVSSDSTFDRDK